MDYDEEDIFKGRPTLRRWDLDDNSTRYDRIVAAPSDQELVAYWYSWAVISITVGLFSLTVFLGILSSRKARGNSFNLYLLYLMVPDFVFNLLCGATCLINAIMGQYTFPWMCNFQQWYCVFGIGANTWLNMLVAHQLHTMLRFSHQRRRYSSPSRRYVTLQAMAVYAYCGFLGTWGLMEKEAFPFHSGSFSGLACLPMEKDTASKLFFWLCFIPLFAGIPFAYIGYVCFDIKQRQLMPPSGRRRTLTVYFGRLIAVFVIMWIPTFVFIWVAGPWLPPWGHFAGGAWSHLQGAVSAGVSLMKPDILGAVKNFLQCRCGEDQIEPVGLMPPAMLGRGPSLWNLAVSRSFRFSSTKSGTTLTPSREMTSAAFAESKAMDVKRIREEEEHEERKQQSTHSITEDGDHGNKQIQCASDLGFWPDIDDLEALDEFIMEQQPHGESMAGHEEPNAVGVELGDISQRSHGESVNEKVDEQFGGDQSHRSMNDSFRRTTLFSWRRSSI